MILCRNCWGGYPAAPLRVRSLMGHLTINLETYSGMVCRACGEKRYRACMWRTGLGGWWSPVGILLTPYYLIENVIAFRRFKQELERLRQPT